MSGVSHTTMRNRVGRQVIYVLGAAMVLLVAVLAVRREPTCQGKTVRQWVYEYAKSGSRELNQAPTLPMQQIGPRAVPLLVTELKRRDTFIHNAIKKLRVPVWRAAPNWARKAVGTNYWNYDLIDAYDIRQAAAITLGSLGAEARSAVPDLRVALSDPTPHVQLRAACAMWQIDHALGTEVLPVLMRLHNNFKLKTMLYFGKIGPDAKAAIPLLNEALRDPHVDIQYYAKWALLKVDVVLVDVAIKPEVYALGLTNTFAKSLGLDEHRKGFTVYFIASHSVSNTLVARAFNADGLEIGRSKKQVVMQKDDAKYVVFEFDSQMDSQMVKQYAIGF